VEFTGAGVRYTTPNPEVQMAREIRISGNLGDQTTIQKSQAVRDIFVGSRTASNSDWIVLPKKKSSLFRSTSESVQGTIKQDSPTSPMGNIKKRRRMSRVLDAILDDPNTSPIHEDIHQSPDDIEATDKLGDSLSPTLRLRGRRLSDSSIHASFMNHSTTISQHGDDQEPDPDETIKSSSSLFPIPILPDRSMFHSLSQRVQTLASSVSNSSTLSLLQSPPRERDRERERGRSKGQVPELPLGSSSSFGFEQRSRSRAREGII